MSQSRPTPEYLNYLRANLRNIQETLKMTRELRDFFEIQSASLKMQFGDYFLHLDKYFRIHYFPTGLAFIKSYGSVTERIDRTIDQLDFHLDNFSHHLKVMESILFQYSRALEERIEILPKTISKSPPSPFSNDRYF